MKNGNIVLLNGTSSSGKTSIVKALQDIMEGPYLEAGIDKFIFMMPDRYLERPLWDDVLGLAVQAGQSGHTLFSGMHHAIAALSRAGNHVIADHVLVEQAWVKECCELFQNLPVYVVGIHCPLQVLEQREAARRNRTPGQAGTQFPLVHRFMKYDVEVDTSRMTPLECAQRIKDRITSPFPPEALDKIRREYIKLSEM